MSLTLLARAAEGPGTPTTTRDLRLNAEPTRKTTDVNTQYLYAQELQRERLRQAETYRLRRLALRARRAVAGQLTR